jgi:DNA-binding SARP family transcriptional activator
VAHQSLSTTLHRLRRLLGSDDVVQRQEGKLSLNPRLCWVDVWAFERFLGHAETAALRMQRNNTGWTELSAFVDKAAALYHGPFLVNEELFWTTSLSDRLRRRLLRAMIELGKQQENKQNWQDAARSYERALEVNAGAEALYQRLMVCQQRLGYRGELVATYNRCKQALRATMGIAPSRETEAIYHSAQSN